MAKELALALFHGRSAVRAGAHKLSRIEQLSPDRWRGRQLEEARWLGHWLKHGPQDRPITRPFAPFSG
jgi:hypothetical protein